MWYSTKEQYGLLWAKAHKGTTGTNCVGICLGCLSGKHRMLCKIVFSSMCSYVVWAFLDKMKQNSVEILHSVGSRSKTLEIAKTSSFWHVQTCPGVQDLSSDCPGRQVLFEQVLFCFVRRNHVMSFSIKFIFKSNLCLFDHDLCMLPQVSDCW